MEILIDLAMLCYLGLLLAIPLVMLGFFLHRVRILKEDWRPILARCVIAMGVWVALSFLMMYVNFLYVYGAAHTPPESRGAFVPMLILLARTMGYGLAGWGLCYWVKGRAANGEENTLYRRLRDTEPPNKALQLTAR